uniref:Uncharacterized protein n=1 Tax=Tanacetum cinerariifolium TaxID=118510 RepID=A0A6L2KHF7_TANCI|nr:hypothetical protein [Tanacetum cinerariifolium]
MEGEESSQQPQTPIASIEAPQMVSSIKLPIINNVQMIKDEAGNEIEVPPVTVQQILARKRKRKAKSTLIMAIPDEHLTRLHGIKDAKTLWATINTIFGEDLDKGYDRFQRLLSLFEIHRAGVSTEDAKQKFLRSLPSAWSNKYLIMRNKPGIDNLDIDDTCNNLKVYVADIKGSSGSSSNSHNLAFVSAESTSSTNELNAAYSVSTATCHNSQAQGSSSYADELMVKRFYKKTRRKLEFNGKEPVVFEKNKVECFTCHRRGNFFKDCRPAKNSGNRSRGARNAGYIGRDNGKRRAKSEDEQALVVQDGLGTYDWSYQVEEEAIDFALMAFISNPSTSSSSNSELDEALKEKGDLKAKLENQLNEKEVLDIKVEEVTENVFDICSSDEENSVANDRFKKDKIDKKSVLPTNVGKGTGHKESRPVWNNVQRKNHQNKFAPTTVFIRSGRIPVSDAKPKAAASSSADKPVNTAGPKQSLNFSRTRSIFHKSHSPIRRYFYNALAHSRGNSIERVNIAGSKAVSAVKGNRVTDVKTSAGYVWRPRVNGHPQQALTNKEVVNNGCSRHMTGNKAYLADYQEIHVGGFVAFGLSRVKITGKGPQDTNANAGTQDNVDVGKGVSAQHYIGLPLWSCISSSYKSSDDKLADDKPEDDTEKEDSDAADALRKEFEQGCMDQRGVTQAGSTNRFNTISNLVNAASTSGTFNAVGPSSPHPNAFIPANTLLHVDKDDSKIPDLEKTAELKSTCIFNSNYDDDLDIYTSPIQRMGAEVNFNNMKSSTIVSHIPTYKVHLDHPKDQILGDPKSAVQTRGLAKKSSGAHALMEPKKVSQAFDDESWVEAMQEELLYLKRQPKLGLWYPRDSPFNLEAYSDSDYAGANLDKKSTARDLKFVDQHNMVACLENTEENVEFHQIVDFLSTCSINYVLTAVVISESSVRSGLLFNDADDISADEAVYQVEGDSVERAITTDASLVVSQDSDNIAETQSTTMSIDPISQEIGSGDRPRRQETTLGGADAQTRSETTSERSTDPPLSTGHVVRSGEDMMEQETDLTDFVPPTPYDSPLLGGQTPKSDEDLVIQRLLKKVKRLEKKQRERTLGMKLFKIGTPKKKTLDKEYVSKQGRDESKEAKELNISDKGSGETEVFDYITSAKKDVNTVELVSTAADAVNAASVIPDVSADGPSQVLLINDIVPMDFEEVNDSEHQVEGSKKRSRVDHEKESVKKHKLKKDDAKKEELAACLEIVPVDDIAIDVESLATKYLIVD